MTSRLAQPLRHTVPLFLLMAALGHGAHAQTTYKCIGDNGVPLYTDKFSPGCTALDVPSAIGGSVPRAASSYGQGRPAAPVAVPAAFPKVNGAQQKARDDDRREILNDELRNEEKKLAELRREFNNGEPERQGNERNYAKYQERVAQMRDNIGRAEKNIDALKREIASVK